MDSLERLVITNGTSAVEALEAAGITGDLCAWNDVLHDGPVPAGLDYGELAHVRARFIADRGWGDLAEIATWFEERDAKLEAAPNFPEVVLWFEHDLYDQLQLVQVLARLSHGRANVSLIQHDRFVAESTPAQLVADFAARRSVTESDYGCAVVAWAAFRSSTPLAAQALVASGRSRQLQFLTPAFRRWFATFPSRSGGVSRTEREILERVAGGMSSPVDLFAASNASEQAAFRGDWSFWALVSGLANARTPLLATGSGKPFESSRAQYETVTLTEAGRLVLEGEADHVDLNGIDSWRGGVHLRPPTIWRWNADLGFGSS